AALTVQGGAQLNAGGSVTVEANASAKLVVTTQVPTGGDQGNVSLSMADNDSTATVDVQSGTAIQGQSASFVAQNTITSTNQATALGATGGTGAVQVLNAYRSHTTAHEAGNVTTSADVTVKANAQETLGTVAGGSLATSPIVPGSLADTLLDD